MLEFLKKNIFIIVLSTITLIVGFLTFLTFIDRGFIQLNEKNLQYLLISNIFLLFLLFIFIFNEIKRSIKNDIDRDGLSSNKRYITYFSLFTLIPSILISVFSLFLFSFALEKYFDKKVTTVVNNSYELAKNYVQEVRDKIEADIILIAFDTNKSSKFLNDNLNEYVRFLRTQKLIRDVDAIHIIDKDKNVLFSSEPFEKYIPPVDRALNLVLDDDRPLKIVNAPANISAAIMRLQSFEDRFLYVVKNLDKNISNYLNESQEAINFYYNVEERSTGITISFAIIYIIIVTLLLFVSITIAIRFSSRFFRSINNLILASTAIGKGDLEVKVPEIKTDKDLEILNKNFNLMTDQLKNQQEKLIINERHEAWSNLARKLAHEIKNPLTPIQLTIDRIKDKYLDKIILRYWTTKITIEISNIVAVERLGFLDSIIGRNIKIVADKKITYISTPKVADMIEAIEKARMNLMNSQPRTLQQNVVQNIVQGDTINKTEIRDSVLNRSNIGNNEDNIAKIEKISEMKDKGLINEEEFNNMKRDILGK